MKRTHEPVLPEEVLEYLAPQGQESLLIDGTVGEGGHSELFLAAFSDLHVIAIDIDREMLERARAVLQPYAHRLAFHRVWFDEFLAEYQGRPVHRILLDLGVSSIHLGDSGRGFSFRYDAPLDMRLSGQGPTAAEVVNTLSERELADLLFHYGGERMSRRIARAIVRRRARTPIQGTAELADTIAGAVPPSYRYGRIHPATRSFQALRIHVNDELGRLKRAIEAAFRILAPGGRFGVISFHSLEDRLVKHRFREVSKEGAELPIKEMGTSGTRTAPFRLITRRPVRPSESEARRNSAARSARFRVIERTEDEWNHDGSEANER